MKLKLIMLLAAFAFGACTQDKTSNETQTGSDDQTVATETGAATNPGTVAPNDYTDVANWLCHPSKASDACETDLDTTLVSADGTTTIEAHAISENPEIDCFYVYPTVSEDPTPNSDMTINDAELRVIEQQFARFSSVCRLYAPLYRQVTLTHLREMMLTGKFKAHPTLNYDDVVDAWGTYLENENNGRGVVILGHSQGAGLISRMVSDELAGSDVMDRIISVMPIGTNIYPEENGQYALPPCTTSTDTACMIGYVTFRGDREPPAESRFGKQQESGSALCVDPAAISGKPVKAHLARRAFPAGQENPFGEDVEVTTPFASLPGMLSTECRSNDTHSWLALDVNGDPDDPRADDIAGDVVVAGQVQEDWGLHLIDMNVAMGNLVSLVESQGNAWRAAR